MLALALSPATPGPGAERLFGDWAVACDNVKRCEATALMPVEWSGGEAPMLDIVREPGPAGAITLRFGWAGRYAGPAIVAIDGKAVYSGTTTGASIEATGAAAEAIARKLANGRTLSIQGRRGQLLGTISLKGASAALRYIDAEQGRAATVTAIVARGTRSAVSVAPAQPLPRIAVPRAEGGKPQRLGEGDLVPLRRRADCLDGQVMPDLKPQFFRLDDHVTLLALPCSSGAYQTGWAMFALTDGRAAPAPFDIAPLGGDPVPSMIDPEFDAKTLTLSSHAKGRGLGDCGVNQSWVWDGSRFRMTLLNGLETCRLSGNWLTRYRAEAVPAER